MGYWLNLAKNLAKKKSGALRVVAGKACFQFTTVILQFDFHCVDFIGKDYFLGDTLLLRL
jgi:hypothetical protein